MRDMPWVDEIVDMHAKVRFLDAWQTLPVRPNQEISQENEVAKVVMVVWSPTLPPCAYLTYPLLG